MITTLVLALALVWPQYHFSYTVEQQLAHMINREHHAVCGRYLYQSWRLKLVARWRAKDMIRRNYFSHTILGTSNRKAWDYYYRWGIRWTMAGEDIGWNSYPANLAARGIFAAFMGSISHRRLFDWCGYRQFGVGAYQGAGPKKMFVVEIIR